MTVRLTCSYYSISFNFYDIQLWVIGSRNSSIKNTYLSASSPFSNMGTICSSSGPVKENTCSGCPDKVSINIDHVTSHDSMYRDCINFLRSVLSTDISTSSIYSLSKVNVSFEETSMSVLSSSSTSVSTILTSCTPTL